MRRLLLPVAFAAAAAIALPLGTPSVSLARPIPSVTKMVFNDPEIECIQATPTQASAIPPLATGTIDVAVAILRDRGLTTARADALLQKASASYAPLGITLSKHSDTAVTFTGSNSQGIINQAKAHFGGGTPAGADVVAVLTNANIDIPGPDGPIDIQGQADCIGGVGFSDRSFVVAEDTAVTLGIPDEGFGIRPVMFYVDFPGKVVAHEIGHLFGAHHHYGNCVEGIPSEPLEVAPCTLMGPSGDFISFNFSTLNATIVRGHAEAFAV